MEQHGQNADHGRSAHKKTHAMADKAMGRLCSAAKMTLMAQYPPTSYMPLSSSRRIRSFSAAKLLRCRMDSAKMSAAVTSERGDMS